MQSTDDQTPRLQRTNTFDIRTGMAVFGAGGQKIGTVLDVAGFGSTKIQTVDAQGAPELVTQAKTGSGYFNVDRREVEGTRAMPPLCVPFHGIQDVVPDRGVILNDTIIEELLHQRDPRPVKTPTPAAKPRRWFPKWLG